MNNKTSYVIKDIERETWMKFRAKCLLNGYDSAGECLIQLIKKYSKGIIE